MRARPAPASPDACVSARWWRENRGSVATEMTLIAPVLVMLLLLVAVVVHRAVDARLRVDAAAHQAARAASIERTAGTARIAAEGAATAALGPGTGTRCVSIGVTADLSRFVAGGTVTVTVSCSVDLADALLLAVPGRADVAATAVEPVDAYRSVGAGPR